MNELRWVLIIGGVLLIGGLLIHGLWSIRKNESGEQETKSKPSSDTSSHSSVSDNTQSIEPKLNAQFAIDDEPEVGDLSINLDDARSQPSDDTESSSNSAVQDYIILHIQTEQGLPMQGSSLLPLLLTLGFKYSEDGLFKRHADVSGQGPVLFSLANMFNPGTFDIDNMEQFQTEGLSLFMTLPCASESLPAFNMLNSAAKKIAEEFSAKVLDHNRQELDVSTVRQYVEKIREFGQV
jgi:cell division protein ZipA